MTDGGIDVEFHSESDSEIDHASGKSIDPLDDRALQHTDDLAPE